MTAPQIITWIVLPAMIALFIIGYTFLMWRYGKKECALIKAGESDAEVIKEHHRRKAKRFTAASIAMLVGQIALFGLLGFFVLAAVYGTVTENRFVLFGKELRLIGSNSMASVNDKNKSYVEENNLTESFNIYDLIVLNELPKERHLKEYDVVAYTAPDGRLIIHRIVEIRATSNGKMYAMRGDANASSDPYLISYDEMYGIYGGKIVGVGAFVRFVQSAFGMIAILTCIYMTIVDEVIGQRIQKEVAARVKVLKVKRAQSEAKKRAEKKKAEAEIPMVEAEVVSGAEAAAVRAASRKARGARVVICKPTRRPQGARSTNNAAQYRRTVRKRRQG